MSSLRSRECRVGLYYHQYDAVNKHAPQLREIYTDIDVCSPIETKRILDSSNPKRLVINAGLEECNLTERETAVHKSNLKDTQKDYKHDCVIYGSNDTDGPQFMIENQRWIESHCETIQYAPDGIAGLRMKNVGISQECRTRLQSLI